MTALDKRDVAAELSAELVLEHFAIPFRRASGQLRFQTCPACGPRGRADAVAISCETGRWLDHAHGCRGDLLALVAGLAGFDVQRDFARVLELAADIAGVAAQPSAAEERARRRELADRQLAGRARREATRRSQSEAGAEVIWERLARTSERGLAYLFERGVAQAAVDVRFGRRSVCLPLRDGAGRILNIVGRRFDGGEPKVRGLAGCGTAGAFGNASLLHRTTGPIVIVEGFADWLSARVLWPERLILGAHGAGRLPDVASIAGELAGPAQRGVLYVPHDDDVGRRHVRRAATAAAAAGVPEEDQEVFLVGRPFKDLNDYLRGTSR